ncbi:MAG: hypothetical protein HY318_17045 [Armatimonadetes bacterium]|nr:hypothetical protein [Armatimonadota bacterium]
MAEGDQVWPGLVEVRLTCHGDKLYLHTRFLLPKGDWVNAGRFVYRPPTNHPAAEDESPTSAGLLLDAGQLRVSATEEAWTVGGAPSLGLLPTLPSTRGTLMCRDEGDLSLALPLGERPWKPGEAREAAVALVIAPNSRVASRLLHKEARPLPITAFETTKGRAEGYDPRTGLYAFRAETSPTPEPPRGLRAGTVVRVTNDSEPRTVLIDSFDPWGGICGGIVRDGEGRPLPALVQFGLNFPELHAEAGEPGWATLTFPLKLGNRETREVRVEHLFGGATDRELLYLTSLDNIGDPLLLQTTVTRVEAHTLTTGLYPGPMSPGNELRVNDFRRIYSQIVERSVSAILPSFFGYYDASGEYQGLLPGAVRFRETGPFLADYSVAARTPDGCVEGSVRVWQAPHADMTRLFTEVDLRAIKPVTLSPDRPAPVFFLRHHAFNPMAYRRYAYLGQEGNVRGDLDFARSIVVNGAPLGPFAYSCLYRADNPIDKGLPCSDIVGNPGWVLLDWDVRIGKHPVLPGVYAFCTGASDKEDGDYARDLAVVPTERVTSLPAGSRIHYRALHVVYGKNDSDEQAMANEREAWALQPMRVQATVGHVVSDWPPEVRASGGRAEFALSGGKNWVPVRVSNLTTGKLVRGWLRTSSVERELTGGAPEETWYSAWPIGDKQMGITFLVQVPAGKSSVQVRLKQE